MTACHWLPDKWALYCLCCLLQVAGMIGPAACLFAAASPFVHSPYLATGLITLGMGLSALTCSEWHVLGLGGCGQL